MDWQLLITCAAITLAGGYVLWRGWRALRGAKGGCSGGCGCAKTDTQPTLIPPEELVLRKR